VLKANGEYEYRFTVNTWFWYNHFGDMGEGWSSRGLWYIQLNDEGTGIDKIVTVGLKRGGREPLIRQECELFGWNSFLWDLFLYDDEKEPMSYREALGLKDSGNE